MERVPDVMRYPGMAMIDDNKPATTSELDDELAALRQENEELRAELARRDEQRRQVGRNLSLCEVTGTTPSPGALRV